MHATALSSSRTNGKIAGGGWLGLQAVRAFGGGMRLAVLCLIRE